jgi:hypothetical protein
MSCNKSFKKWLSSNIWERQQKVKIDLTKNLRGNSVWGMLPIEWIPEDVSLRVKRPGREADHPHPSNAGVKNVSSHTSAPPIHLHSVMLR